MDPAVARGLRSLLTTQPVAALGTLHEGEPYVSMAPFALLPGGRAFVVHVSALAAHTRDMLEAPQVSLLVMAPPAAGTPPQALARVTIQGDARRLAATDGDYAEARAAYLARFPDSGPMFELTDFALFAIAPRSLRLVGGFAQAKTLTPAGLAEALAGG